MFLKISCIGVFSFRVSSNAVVWALGTFLLGTKYAPPNISWPPISWTEIVVVSTCTFMLLVLRTVLGGMEERHFGAALRARLQRQWASSFKVHGLSNDTLNIPLYPQFKRGWPLIRIYILWSCLILALLPPHVQLLIDQFRDRTVRDTYLGSYYVAYTTTLLAIWQGIPFAYPPESKGSKTWSIPVHATMLPYLWACLELSVRIIYIIHVLAQHCTRSLRSNTHRTRTHIDSREIWTELGSTALATVLVLIYPVLAVIDVLEGSSKLFGPGSAMIYLWVELTAIFLCGVLFFAGTTYRTIMRLRSADVVIDPVDEGYQD